MRRRHALDFAADHALMTWQHAERRATGRGLQAGDFVQAHVGGEIREVEKAYSAGECLEAWVDVLALEARAPKRDG